MPCCGPSLGDDALELRRALVRLTTKRIRRGAFVSVPDRNCAIDEFLAAWNERHKPFVWTATVESICKTLSQCRKALGHKQPGCTPTCTSLRKKPLSN